MTTLKNNALMESMGSKCNAIDKRLPMGWFRNWPEAKVIIKDWRQHDNSVRPHSSLGNMTPAAYACIAQDNVNREATLNN